MVSQLKAAAKQKDYAELKRIAHKLKSNVQSVGLTDVYAWLDKIESDWFSGVNDEKLQKALDDVFQKCEIAVAEVETELLKQGNR